MRFQRKKLGRFAAVILNGCMVAAGACAIASAAQYPERPVTLVVGFPPGGGADAVARIVTERMAKTLEQPFVIENRPGAGTTLAATRVARAKPDGYTLLLGGPSLFGLDKLLYKSVSYGAQDFAAVTQWTTAPMILTVSSASTIRSVADLIETAKRRSDSLFVASSGTGGSPHLAALAFEKQVGVKFTHVPFKGGSPAVQAVVAGDVQLIFGTPPSVLPLIEAGRLRGIGITSSARSALLPDMPTIAEQGVPGYDHSFWFSLLAPTGTDRSIIERLYAASVEALGDPEIKEKLAQQGNDVKWSESSEAFTRWMLEDARAYLDLARDAGLEIQ